MNVLNHNLVAVPEGQITEEMLAGYYLLFSIPETDVPLLQARNAFTAHGLDPSKLPESRKPEHVMMNACKAAERIIPQDENGYREEIRAQQVGRDEHHVIYQMTRHVHKVDSEVINHPKALRVRFNHADSSLSFELLDDSTWIDVQSLIDEIREYYNSHQDMLPARGLRTVVTNYIRAAGAESIRDGVYFLPTTTRLYPGSGANGSWQADTQRCIPARTFIEAMEGALKDTLPVTPLFHAIRCVNDTGEREFLKTRFVENCAQDLKAYRDDCLELVTGMGERKRAVGVGKRSSMVSRRQEIDARRQRFAEILGETLVELDQDMSLADEALLKFLREANES